jgi:hypothetical protein
MQKLPWTALGLIAVGATMNVVFTGCGSDSEPETPTESDSGPAVAGVPADAGGLTDAITDGRRADAADCKLVAQTCATSAECCSANCNATTQTCDAPLSPCGAPGASCAAGPDCCTSSCIGNACSAKQCVADNLACGTDSECCGGKCAPDGSGGGKCTPLNPGGPATGGNPCVADTDCASKFCNNGVCTGSSFCAQNGDVCTAATDCCGGLCTKAAGAALGVCGTVSAGGAGGCEQAGTLCTGTGGACGGNCCSRSCAPYLATGKSICQPASGCHVLGDLCRANSDCCGWSGSPQPLVGEFECVKGTPTQEFGLCGKGNSCKEPGSICGKALEANGTTSTLAVCSAANNCCELSGLGGPNCNTNPEQCCRRDALGVPRCIINKTLDCSGAPPAPGTVCATSADCCGKPCVNNKCSGTCVAAGNECTSTADCCSGLPCAIAAGASKGFCGGTVLEDGGVSAEGGPPPVTQDGGTAGDGGVCSLYGQACGSDGDCCSGVPCLGGTCHYP